MLTVHGAVRIVINCSARPRAVAGQCGGRKETVINRCLTGKERYRAVIAQVALRTIHEILISTSGSVIDLVTFYGYVSTKDPATGQPIRPLLLQVSATREVFSSYLLSELDPVACLKRLNALVSPHPYDLEPVQPTVDFDSLLPAMDVPRLPGHRRHDG